MKVPAGLAAIAPTWAQAIIEAPTPKSLPSLTSKGSISLSDAAHCVVGESHGWKNKYSASCKRCDEFSFLLITYHTRVFQRHLAAFVAHFEAAHRHA